MSKQITSLDFNVFLLRPIIKSKMNYKELASLCGVEKQAIANWFSTGKMPAKHALVVCRIFDLSREEIKEIFQ